MAVTVMSGAQQISNSRSRMPVMLEKYARSLLRRLSLGRNVAHGSDLRVGFGAVINSPHGLTLGHGVSIGQRTVIEVDGTVGSFCLIARHVQIVGRVDHAIDEVGIPTAYSTWVGDRPQQPQDAVTIGRDVWLGAGVIVLGGVAIGEGSIVGAGSVVTKSLPPFSIAVGNPARVLRQRFRSVDERLAHSLALDQLERKIASLHSGL